MHIYVDTSNFKAATIGELDFAAGCIFEVGMRVRIISGPASDSPNSYYGRYIGHEGEVVRCPQGIEKALSRESGTTVTIGVIIDNKRNERSQYGCYWFRPDELQIIDTKEEADMLLLKGYKTVKVNIQGYGEHYVAHYEQELLNDTPVVVTSSSGDYYSGIVSSDDIRTTLHPKFQVVCKVDDTDYKIRCTKAQKAKELEDKLNAAVKDYQQIALYEMLAEKSPGIAALLKELKEVTNG